jgi:transcription antitermination factor NusG
VLDNPEIAHKSARATVPPPQLGGEAPCLGNPEPETLIKPGRGGYRPGAGRKPRVIPEPVVDETERWYCVRTNWSSETPYYPEADLIADIEIRRAGFTVFAPTIWKAPVPTKRDDKGRIIPAIGARVVPLFPRYLFVQFVRSRPDWYCIRRLPGVRMIFGSAPDRPTPVPDAAIDAIRAQCAPNGCIYPPDPDKRAPRLEQGSKVRVLTGPMADAMEQDLLGICEMSDGKRVKVLLQIMGRAVSVTMAQSAVEVVR